MTSEPPRSTDEQLDTNDVADTDHDQPTATDHDQPTTDHDQPTTDHDTDSETDEENADDARRPWGRIALAVAAVLVVLIGGIRILSLTSERNDLVDEVAALEESLQIARGDLGGQIERLETDNAELLEQIQQLQSLFTETVTDLDASIAANEELVEQLDARQEELDELTAELEELLEIIELTGTEIELMPDLLGTPIEEVRELALELGVELVELPIAPGNVIARPGDVIEQLPLEDTPLLPGSVVWVEVFAPLDEDS